VDGAADSLSADEASLRLVEGDDPRVASSTRTRAGEAEAWQQRARRPRNPGRDEGEDLRLVLHHEAAGRGTGLGLAVSREILQAHGGNLRIEDTPEGGATFILDIPRERPGA
jgi:Histidine kinase-, DNA gyrase B-, and HSP90-like ATPase